MRSMMEYNPIIQKTILTDFDDAEIVKKAINRYMNRAVTTAIQDVDVVVFLIERLQWLPEDEHVAKRLANLSCPVILAINKVDKIEDKEALLPHMQQLLERLVQRAQQRQLVDHAIDRLPKPLADEGRDHQSHGINHHHCQQHAQSGKIKFLSRQPEIGERVFKIGDAQDRAPNRQQGNDTGDQTA